MTPDSDPDCCYQEVDLPVGPGVRLRVHTRTLTRPDGAALGRVILAREISHEPQRRHFEEILDGQFPAVDGSVIPPDEIWRYRHDTKPVFHTSDPDTAAEPTEIYGVTSQPHEH